MVERDGAELDYHQRREADLRRVGRFSLHVALDRFVRTRLPFVYVMSLQWDVRDNTVMHAGVAQLVEHVLGKDGVTGSIPVSSFLLETPLREDR